MARNPFFSSIDRPVILVSRSPRRAILLEQVGLEFMVRPAEINESQFETADKSPEQVAISLATQKAAAIAKQLSTPTYIIGADTIVCTEDTIHGKPSNPEEAKATLSRLSGQSHTVITGVIILTVPEQEEITFAETTEVHFRDLSASEIDAYVNTEEPMDKAGAYGIQGLGALLIEYIHGDYNNVVGFPLSAFYQHFRRMLASN